MSLSDNAPTQVMHTSKRVKSSKAPQIETPPTEHIPDKTIIVWHKTSRELPEVFRELLLHGTNGQYILGRFDGSSFRYNSFGSSTLYTVEKKDVPYWAIIEEQKYI